MGIFSRQTVGIDIGRSAIRVVGLELGKQPRFVGCKEAAIDPKYLGKEGFSDPLVVGQILKEAVKSASPKPLSSSEAYIALNEETVFRKILDMPVMENPDELEQAVRLEVAQYLPENPENMEMDYQLLGPLPGGKLQQVMVAAVSRKTVQDYMAVVESAKLSLKAIDVSTSAIGRAVVGRTEKGIFLLADIGEEASSISLYEGNLVRVTGSINLGGNIILDPDTGEVDEDQQEVRLKRLASALSDEIDHVQKFYSNRSVGQGKAKEIRLSGEGSLITEMAAVLEKEADLPTAAARPVIGVPPFCDRRFYAALGAAMYPSFDQL